MGDKQGSALSVHHTYFEGVVFLNVFKGLRLVIVQLVCHGAKSEENAETLSKLGLGDLRVIKWVLSKDNVLTKTVALVSAVKYDYETYAKMDKRHTEVEKKFTVVELYVKKDVATRAAFITERYVVSVVRTAMACAFFLLCRL